MQTGNNSKTYHRYCPHCGWGYPRQAWEIASYCTKCGSFLNRQPSVKPRGPHQSANKQANRAHPQTHICFGCKRKFSTKEWQRYTSCPSCHRSFNKPEKSKGKRQANTYRVATSKRRPSQVQVLPPERITKANKVSLAEKTFTLAQRHPLAAGCGGALLGGGMVVSGQAISALGIGVSAAGNLVAGIGTFGLIIGTFGKDKSAAAGGLVGIGLGLGMSVVGSAMAIAGQAVSIGGVITIGGSGCLAGYGLVKTLDNNKHKRVHAVAISQNPKFLTA